MSRLESMIAANIVTDELPQTTGEVSERFLNGARKALDIYRSWGLRWNVDLSRFTPVVHKDGGDRVAAFFTLGVDSFYTLLTHLDEIDDLIYVTTFELKLSERILEEVVEKINFVAEHLGKNAVFIESDIRDRLDRYAHWHTYGHSPALASIGLSMEDRYRKIYIAATNDREDHAYHVSSHPQIDHLWSTETLEFVHDAPITRPEKIRRISEHQFALDLIRVCYKGTSYNCSKCSKCVRTMISIHLLGLNSASFGKFPPLRDINRLGQKERRLPSWPNWHQNIEEAENLLKAMKGQL